MDGFRHHLAPNLVLGHLSPHYEILNDARRHYTQEVSGISLCDNVNDSYKKNNWKGTNTYRIFGPAGAKLKEGCVTGAYNCGSYQQGYISAGIHPTIPGQRENMTVCYKTGATCLPDNPGICKETIEILAIHCGSYFVYNLLDFSNCFAYCTE